MKENTIEFLKVRNVKSPDRAFATDAGIDFFVPVFDADFVQILINKNPKTFKLKTESPKAPKFEGEYYMGSASFAAMGYKPSEDGSIPRRSPQDFFGFDIEKGKAYFILEPGKGVKIPAGVHCKMGEKRMLRAANKSSVATDFLLDITAEIVDHSYQGEIHIALKNDSNEEVRIYDSMKIVQFIEVPIYTSEVAISSGQNPKEWYEKESERGDGGFGSTDLKI